MADTVSIGFLMLWRLAGCPTRTSPSSVKATMEGVVRPPSAFSMTLALFPSITATQELVVPRSIPIAFAMTRLLLSDGYALLLPLGAPRRPQCRRTQWGAASDVSISAGRAKRVEENASAPRSRWGLKRPA